MTNIKEEEQENSSESLNLDDSKENITFTCKSSENSDSESNKGTVFQIRLKAASLMGLPQTY